MDDRRGQRAHDDHRRRRQVPRLPDLVERHRRRHQPLHDPQRRGRPGRLRRRWRHPQPRRRRRALLSCASRAAARRTAAAAAIANNRGADGDGPQPDRRQHRGGSGGGICEPRRAGDDADRGCSPCNDSTSSTTPPEPAASAASRSTRRNRLDPRVLTRSTIADNTGGSRGVGGLRLRHLRHRRRSTGSIVARNTRRRRDVSNCGGRSSRPTTRPTSRTTRTCGFSTRSVDPRPGDRARPTQGGEVDVLAITAASPAVDRSRSASNCPAGTRDQRGLYRPQGSLCDSGAYELDQAGDGDDHLRAVRHDHHAATSSSTSRPREPGVHRVSAGSTGPGQSRRLRRLLQVQRAAVQRPRGRRPTRSRCAAVTFLVPEPAADDAHVHGRHDTAGHDDHRRAERPDQRHARRRSPSRRARPDRAFQCRVDSAPFATCTSPRTTARARGRARTPSEVRAHRRRRDVRTRRRRLARSRSTLTAPDTTITGGPTGAVASTSADVHVHARPSPVRRSSARSTAPPSAPASPNYTGSQRRARTRSRSARRDAAGQRRRHPRDAVPGPSTPSRRTRPSPPARPARPTTPRRRSRSPRPRRGSTFQCRVDGAAFATCPSPFTTAALADGQRTRSRSAPSTPRATPTPRPRRRRSTVDTTAPNTTITAGPTGPTNDATPTFTFTSTEAGVDLPVPRRHRARSPPARRRSRRRRSPTAPTRSRSGRSTPPATSTRTPASQTFTVDTTPPAAADRRLRPRRRDDEDLARVRVLATETVTCRLDGPSGAPGEFGPCTSPKRFDTLAPGDYVFTCARSTPRATGRRRSGRSRSRRCSRRRRPPRPHRRRRRPPRRCRTSPVERRREAGGTVLVAPAGHEDVRAARRHEGHHERLRGRHPQGSRDADVDPEGRRAAGDRQVLRRHVQRQRSRAASPTLTLSEKLTGCKQAKKTDARAAAAKKKTPQAVGQRQGQVPHHGPVQRGDRPRHDLARPGHLHAPR